jgi:hypothetical protein
MVPLLALWAPILLSAIAVFIVSSLVHTVLGYHHTDFGKVPAEEAVMDALRKFDIPPGDYLMPRPGSREEMKSGEYQAKFKRGPVAMITVMSGTLAMGKQFVQWFVYVLVVGTIAAYVAGHALGPGAPWTAVFRFAGTVAFAAYGLALWQSSIWYSRSWRTTLKSNFDALIYALVTAGIFGWLWPK